MILDGDSGTKSWFAKTTGKNQPHNTLPMPPPGFEQLKHALVVHRPASERPAHHRWKVVVANADRVRIAVGSLSGFRGSPHSHTGDAAKASVQRRITGRNSRQTVH